MSISSCGCPLWHLKGSEIIRRPLPHHFCIPTRNGSIISIELSCLSVSLCFSAYPAVQGTTAVEQLLLREHLLAPAMGRHRLHTKWRAFTCACVQNESCSHEYFQEQQSSYETARYDRQYLDRRPHSGCSAMAAAAASAASASTRDRLCWQAKGSRFHPNRISQDKFNFIIFS